MRHTSVFTTLAYMSYKQEEIDRAILRVTSLSPQTGHDHQRASEVWARRVLAETGSGVKPIHDYPLLN